VLSSTSDRGRAEAAAAALGARADGAVALGRALSMTEDDERVALLARLLRPRARALVQGEAGAAGRKMAAALVSLAVARAGRGGAHADAMVSLARELDRAATAQGLRAEAAKQRKR